MAEIVHAFVDTTWLKNQLKSNYQDKELLITKSKVSEDYEAVEIEAIALDQKECKNPTITTDKLKVINNDINRIHDFQEKTTYSDINYLHSVENEIKLLNEKLSVLKGQ